MTNKEIKARQWFGSYQFADDTKFVSPGEETMFVCKDGRAEIGTKLHHWELGRCLSLCRHGIWHEDQPETVIRYLRKQRQLAKLAQE